MSITIYQKSAVGQALLDTLASMKESNKITEALAEKVTETFDQTIFEELEKQARTKCTCKGLFSNAKTCDDIWIFYSHSTSFKADASDLTSDRLKIVACDAQMKKLYEPKKKKIEEAIEFDE